MNTPSGSRAPRRLPPTLYRLLLLFAFAPATFGASPAPAAPAAPPSSGAVEETFKRALFDEEGRRDYPAALRGYEEVVRALDEQRRLAATAVFRLGECYRKLGRTNDAVAQYQRLLRDFAGEEPLTTLSLQNLAGLGLSPALPGAITVTGIMSDPAFAAGSPPSLPPGSPGPAATTEEAEEIRRIQSVVANSPDLVNAAKDDLTPLAAAAGKGQLTVARYLLDHGADPASLASRDGTALFYAAGAGHKAMAELLLARGTPVNAAAPSGTTPLHQAAQNGFRSIVELLLKSGADPDVLGYLHQPPPRTPLGSAILGRHTAVAKLLLDQGADPNRRSPGQLPALAFAETSDLVRLLLEHRADPNLDGGRRLLRAVQGNDLPVTTLLLEAGARPDLDPAPPVPPEQRGLNPAAPRGARPPANPSPLLAALSSDRLDLAELLLKHGADINRPGADAVAPIHWAAQSAGTNSLAWVLDHGGNPNLRDGRGRIPLERTGIAGLRSPVDAEAQAWNRALLILARGADPNLPFSDGQSFLHVAARSGGPEVFTALTGRVTNVNVNVALANANGRTPLILAAALGNEPAVEWLLMAGAKVDAVDSDDATALLHATVRRDIANVRRLLEAGANPTTPSAIGNSPLSYIQQECAPNGLRDDGTYDLRITGRAAPNERPAYRELLELLSAHAGTNAVVATPRPARPQPQNLVAFFGALQGTMDLPGGRPITLTDAILAQPQSKTADLRRVRLHRHPESLAEGEAAILEVDVTELLRNNDRSKDVILRPGDRIEVKEKVF